MGICTTFLIWEFESAISPLKGCTTVVYTSQCMYGFKLSKLYKVLCNSSNACRIMYGTSESDSRPSKMFCFVSHQANVLTSATFRTAVAPSSSCPTSNSTFAITTRRSRDSKTDLSIVTSAERVSLLSLHSGRTMGRCVTRWMTHTHTF